jgi:hypothetical protein
MLSIHKSVVIFSPGLHIVTIVQDITNGTLQKSNLTQRKHIIIALHIINC